MAAQEIVRRPGFAIFVFSYKYFLRLGFLDGVPGLIYCGLQGVQFFHIKAKIYELDERANTGDVRH